jgi:hypothetical protein
VSLCFKNSNYLLNFLYGMLEYLIGGITLISIQGTIEKASDTQSISTGIVEKTSPTTLRITELPIKKWTNDYKVFFFVCVFVLVELIDNTPCVFFFVFFFFFVFVSFGKPCHTSHCANHADSKVPTFRREKKYIYI